MTSPNPNEDVTPVPVWDGEGDDPWLPARLQALLDAGRAERSIYEAVWDALSSWLVATTRRVLRGPVIDTDAILAQEPAWQDRITQIIIEGVLPVMSWAYEGIFGPGYDWRERPNVISYLTGVRNRLSREPQETFDLVAGQIAAGVTLGEGMPELRDRVDEVLSTTKSARWKNRAAVIARTESLGALNGSRADAFQAFAEEGGEDMERMWLSTIDSRTRPSHVLADGQRVGLTEPFIVGGFPLMFPGDPSGPAGEVIQCLPGSTIVEYGSIRAVTRRWFEGEVITLHFATGDELTITPNHPVLRADGQWVPAGLLSEGEYCVSTVGRGEVAREPHEDGGPAQIGEVYRAAREAQSPQRIPLSPPDFHGDVTDGDVEVVTANGALSFRGKPATDQQVIEFGLSLADEARARQRSRNSRLVPVGPPWAEVNRSLSPLGVSRSGQLPSFSGGHSGHTESVGLAGSAGSQVQVPEASGDDVAVDSHGTGNCQHAFPVDVATTKIVKVDRSVFRGHVFNLDTGVGWYIANGITVRNCRCTTLLLEVGENVDMSRRQLRRR